MDTVSSFRLATYANRGNVKVTVTGNEPLTDPKAAVIVALPVVRALASPAGLMLITLGWEETHATEPVRSWMLPSVKIPIALNCWVVPRGISALAGLTKIETRAGATTLQLVEPVTLPEVASMVALPWLFELANPAPLIVATAGAEELQVTALVKS